MTKYCDAFRRGDQEALARDTKAFAKRTAKREGRTSAQREMRDAVSEFYAAAE